MAITIRLERTAQLRAAVREAMLRGSWLDIEAWAECRRAGRWRFVRAIALCAWLLPVLVAGVRAWCVFMPDLECSRWVDGHWGMLLLAALIWATVAHAAAEIEWWLCEEKYLHELARGGAERAAEAAGPQQAPSLEG